ncbi:hypothetical protein FC19_GL002118 [Liquorilactobacillus aquaticus DSM 21051]|uniref:Gram-positive cocci surface proteins LPxTG domain-containing protein n=1 Tax=Liquorilactobacillus aquaticus DSM 21051 TaxID=1423725 RepID=A0A0R2CV14_9LACO|nr:LPXTG cell wall anchor domain-containing protein [Liquorilactobacillus aquaticus]KRM95026.1 hypothetical protein FC19_GL002118 [Liquorilactobacillus aquaticus DSM 21051]
MSTSGSLSGSTSTSKATGSSSSEKNSVSKNKEKLPQTGDESDFAWNVVGMLTAFLSVLGLRKKNKNNKGNN